MKIPHPATGHIGEGHCFWTPVGIGVAMELFMLHHQPYVQLPLLLHLLYWKLDFFGQTPKKFAPTLSFNSWYNLARARASLALKLA